MSEDRLFNAAWWSHGALGSALVACAVCYLAYKVGELGKRFVRIGERMAEVGERIAATGERMADVAETVYIRFGKPIEHDCKLEPRHLTEHIPSLAKKPFDGRV